MNTQYSAADGQASKGNIPPNQELTSTMGATRHQMHIFQPRVMNIAMVSIHNRWDNARQWHGTPSILKVTNTSMMRLIGTLIRVLHGYFIRRTRVLRRVLTEVLCRSPCWLLAQGAGHRLLMLLLLLLILLRRRAIGSGRRSGCRGIDWLGLLSVAWSSRLGLRVGLAVSLGSVLLSRVCGRAQGNGRLGLVVMGRVDGAAVQSCLSVPVDHDAVDGEGNDEQCAGTKMSGQCQNYRSLSMVCPLTTALHQCQPRRQRHLVQDR